MLHDGEIEIVFEDDDEDGEDEEEDEEAAAATTGQTEAEITAQRRQRTCATLFGIEQI